MKVTFSMILSHLSRKSGLKPSLQYEDLHDPITQVLAYAERETPHGEALYIADHLPAKRCQNLILVGKAAHNPVNPTGNLACFPDATRNQLLRACAGALAYYYRFEEEMLEKMAACDDCDQILSYCHAHLNAPMILHSSSEKVLAATRDDVLTESMWEKPAFHGYPAADSPQERAWLQTYAQLVPRDGRAKYISDPAIEYPFISCAVMLNERPAAFLNAAEKNGPFFKGDLDFIESICRLLVFEVQKLEYIRVNCGPAYEGLIRDLLEGKSGGERTVLNRARVLGWTLGPVQQVVCMVEDNAYPIEAKLIDILDDLIGYNLPGKGICDRGALYFVLSADEKHLSACRRFLMEYCGRHHLRSGFSACFEDLLDTSRYRVQASRALELSTEPHCRYEDLAYWDMISVLQQSSRLEQMLHPGIRILKKYDAENSTELHSTLKTYCQCLFNQSRTAQAMHIHRTTIVYRLRRIEELTGFQLQNARELIRIALTLDLDGQT